MQKKQIFKLALVLIPLIGLAKVMRFRAWQQAGGAPSDHHWHGPRHHHGFRSACRGNSVEPNIQHA